MLEKIALGCWKNVLGKRKKTAKALIGLVRAALHNPAFSLFRNFQRTFPPLAGWAIAAPISSSRCVAASGIA
jgi:hypothetical protein